MAELASVIAAAMDYPHPLVERAIFGTDDPAHIAEIFDGFVRRTLGVDIAEGEFFVSSVGSVLGVRLEDGRRVVVKAHQPNVLPARLSAIGEVQTHFAEVGFPAPRPLTVPVPLIAGLATIEETLDTGEPPDGALPATRTRLARELQRLHVLGVPFLGREVLAAHEHDREPGAVFGSPHSPLFDFDATREGADWIEDLGRRALEVLDAHSAGAMVVTHMDWRVENLRCEGDALSAVYDWDSIRRERETVAVGHNAHSFSINWHMTEPRVTELDAALAFVDDYERARGAPFTADEHRAVKASWVHSTAYGARCEHSALPIGIEPVPHGFRQRLADHGEEMLG